MNVYIKAAFILLGILTGLGLTIILTVLTQGFFLVILLIGVIIGGMYFLILLHIDDDFFYE